MLPSVESVLAQTLPADAYEVVVVDNCSTDGTAEAVKALAPEHPGVRYLYEGRLGLATARNTSAELAPRLRYLRWTPAVASAAKMRQLPNVPPPALRGSWRHVRERDDAEVRHPRDRDAGTTRRAPCRPGAPLPPVRHGGTGQDRRPDPVLGRELRDSRPSAGRSPSPVTVIGADPHRLSVVGGTMTRMTVHATSPDLTARAVVVGQLKERRLLVDAWNRVRSGAPGVVLLGGEAGIGKSTLLSWLSQQLGPDSQRVTGQCVPLGEEGLALAPLTWILRELVASHGLTTVREWAGAGWRSLSPLLPSLIDGAVGPHDRLQQFEAVARMEHLELAPSQEGDLSYFSLNSIKEGKPSGKTNDIASIWINWIISIRQQITI